MGRSGAPRARASASLASRLARWTKRAAGVTRALVRLGGPPGTTLFSSWAEAGERLRQATSSCRGQLYAAPPTGLARGAGRRRSAWRQGQSGTCRAGWYGTGMQWPGGAMGAIRSVAGRGERDGHRGVRSGRPSRLDDGPSRFGRRCRYRGAHGPRDPPRRRQARQGPIGRKGQDAPGDPQERLGAQRALEQFAKDLEVMADFAGRPADDEDGE